jgi:hypothetical protein
MAKKNISSDELAWIFYEKLKNAQDCPPAMRVAVIPDSHHGWTAVTSAEERNRYPLCASRIEKIQKQLRAVFKLKEN